MRDRPFYPQYARLRDSFRYSATQRGVIMLLRLSLSITLDPIFIVLFLTIHEQHDTRLLSQQ
jgi:hypothetical protein